MFQFTLGVLSGGIISFATHSFFSMAGTYDRTETPVIEETGEVNVTDQ